jgi:serine phosphatase RsbU (regulator of sigma subunit)/DNA-binding LacI/PurR family transcriptional regulator
VGVFIEWFTDGYTDPIFDEIVTAARERDVDVVCFMGNLAPTDFPVPRRNITQILAAPETLDGLLVVTLGHAWTPEQIPEFVKTFEPLPMASVTVPWETHPRVMVENEAGLRDGIRHLIRTHHRRRIGFVRGPESSEEAETRYRVYREVLEEHGIPFDPALVAPGLYIRRNGVEAIRLWLDERKVTFDAVVAANDGMALGVRKELEDRNIRIPETVALMGFDDEEEVRFVKPPLTTVRQPLRLHGRTAFEVLFAQMRGEKVPAITVLRSELILRSSCGCAPSDADPALAEPDETGSPARFSELANVAFSRLTAGEGGATNALPIVVESFATAAATGDGAPFLRALGDFFEIVARKRGDVGGAVRAMRELGVRVRRHFAPGAPKREKLNRLLEAGALLASEAAERAQAVQRARAVDLTRLLFGMSQDLSSIVDLPTMREVIGRHLPEFKIGRCFVCIYEEGKVPAETARLVLAHDPRRPVDIPPEGIAFSCRQLLPLDLVPDDAPSTFLVGPMLRTEPTPIGYIVLERGVAEGIVYDGLFDQIGSTYKRIRLLEELEQKRRATEERERLEKELRIAASIQTGVLPRSIHVEGLEISGFMQPASEVGGDYYDVIPVENGCWIGIGDVAGHGLAAGLVMLMLQSAIGALTRQSPGASPTQILPIANDVLFDNIRRRMLQDEHITLMLLRYDRSGSVLFSGAHEEILICRARDGRVDVVSSTGPWLGAAADIRAHVSERSCRLEPGDVMLLYTDGITEARNAEGKFFGVERLIAALARERRRSVDEIRDAVVAEVRAWMASQDDDLTLLIARHTG